MSRRHLSTNKWTKQFACSSTWRARHAPRRAGARSATRRRGVRGLPIAVAVEPDRENLTDELLGAAAVLRARHRRPRRGVRRSSRGGTRTSRRSGRGRARRRRRRRGGRGCRVRTRCVGGRRGSMGDPAAEHRMGSRGGGRGRGAARCRTHGRRGRPRGERGRQHRRGAAAGVEAGVRRPPRCGHLRQLADPDGNRTGGCAAATGASIVRSPDRDSIVTSCRGVG